MAIVAFKTFHDSVEANIALTKLQANEIPCFLTNEETTQLLWHMSMAMGGIKLMLNESDIEKADEILLPESNTIDDLNDLESKCPDCRSNNVKFGALTKTKYGLLGTIISLIFMIPAPFAKRGYHCFNCGNEYSKEKS